MPMARVSFHRLNPCRPLDWRWQIARQIASPTAGTRVRSHNAIVVEAARFLTGLGQQPDSEVPAELVQQYPAIAAAYGLSRRGDWERLVLEARILAGEPLDEIARRCAVPEPVIEKYEALFFTIRNALRAKSYCWQAAIRCRRVSPETPPALEKLIRKWSYFGGSHVLETALPAIGRHGMLIDRPANLASAKGRRDEHVRVAAKLSMATEEPEDAMDLLRAMPFIVQALERMPAYHAAGADRPMFDVSEIVSRPRRRSSARPALQAAA
jgi:hypothetical protein